MLTKINKIQYNLDQTFVHRNAFLHLCDFIYTKPGDSWCPEFSGQKSSFDNIYKNNVIFVTPHCINEFLEEAHPKINNQYILITYCHGAVFDQRKYIDDPKILAWFGAANRESVTFEKFNVIPIGVFCNDELFNNRADINDYIIKLKNENKNNLLYMNFAVHQNRDGVRDIIYNSFKDKQYCKTVTLTQTWRKPWKEYIKDVAQSKFVLSPLGDMCDCYRHWESMLLGSIPIIQNSPLNEILSDLPAIAVDDFNVITEEFLNEKYIEMKNKQFNTQKLYMRYWSDLINGKKI